MYALQILSSLSPSPAFETFKHTHNMFSLPIGIRLFLPILIPAIILRFLIQPNQLPSELVNTSISLLIAHPDDEAMFFTPILAQLAAPESNNNVSIICFSTGDFEGLGQTRRLELEHSAQLFGVKGGVVVIDEPRRFPDSMSVDWDEEMVLQKISQLLDKNTKVLTFDADGVSGHPNHQAMFRAVVLDNEQNGREVYVLDSLPIWRKYGGLYDALISYLKVNFWNEKTGEADNSKLQVFANMKNYFKGRSAMTEAHISQMKWFRHGWITLSRYMYANDLTRL